MFPLRPIILAGCAALLAACVSDPHRPYDAYDSRGRNPPPGSAQRDSVDATRGRPNVRVIEREGPISGSDTAVSPEMAARQQAGQHCGSVGLEPHVLDLQRQRAYVRPPGGTPVQVERVRLTFQCERGQP